MFCWDAKWDDVERKIAPAPDRIELAYCRLALLHAFVFPKF